MDVARREELEKVMAGIVAGDRAMVVGLATAFGPELRGTLVALAPSAGVSRLRQDDLDGLVFEAAAELARVAGAWDPHGGALPWVWGRQRLLALLRAQAGSPALLLADPYNGRGEPADPAPVAWGGPEPEATAVLAGAARHHQPAALVHAALERAVPARDRDLLLRHAQQVADGDPSPAVTVAREVDRSPDAVRQAVRRSRRRLADLALAEARFRPLLRLPLLGPAALADDDEVAA